MKIKKAPLRIRDRDEVFPPAPKPTSKASKSNAPLAGVLSLPPNPIPVRPVVPEPAPAVGRMILRAHYTGYPEGWVTEHLVDRLTVDNILYGHRSFTSSDFEYTPGSDEIYFYRGKSWRSTAGRVADLLKTVWLNGYTAELSFFFENLDPDARIPKLASLGRWVATPELESVCLYPRAGVVPLATRLDNLAADGLDVQGLGTLLCLELIPPPEAN